MESFGGIAFMEKYLTGRGRSSLRVILLLAHFLCFLSVDILWSCCYATSILLESKITLFFLKLLLVIEFCDSNRKGTESSSFSRCLDGSIPHCMLNFMSSLQPFTLSL